MANEIDIASLDGMKYADLRKLAKKYGIKANMKVLYVKFWILLLSVLAYRHIMLDASKSSSTFPCLNTTYNTDTTN